MTYMKRFLQHFSGTPVAGAVLIAVFCFAVFFFSLLSGAWTGSGNGPDLSALMDRVAASPWSFPGVIVLYCLLGLVAFPQFLLITGTVIAFGPVEGALYAWSATMVSLLPGYFAGRLSGVERVITMCGARAGRIMDRISDRGMIVSALARIVPTAPFFVVNVCAGAVRIPLWKFLPGSGAGIIPKILAVAALGAFSLSPGAPDMRAASLAGVFSGRTPADFIYLLPVVVVVAGVVFFRMRAYLRIRCDKDMH